MLLLERTSPAKCNLNLKWLLISCRLTDVVPTGDAEQDAMDKKRQETPNPHDKADSAPSSLRLRLPSISK